MTDKRLLKAGIIAIPIKSIKSIGILSPNFFVIEKQEGREIKKIHNFQTTTLEDTVCTIAQYKLSKREILPSVELKPEIMIDRNIQEIEAIAIPYEFLFLLKDYQSIKNNTLTINAIFSLFTFRGTLQNLKLEIDEEVLDKIIEGENIQEESNIIELNINETI